MFYDHADIHSREKKPITKYVEKIELTYVLTPTTINIQTFINDAYHYEGVMILTVQLRNNPNNKQVNILEVVIHGSLPNPVLILFLQNEKMMLSSCMKRLSKVSKSEVVLEGIHHTEWFSLDGQDDIVDEFISSIELTNLSFNNFYEFYKEMDLAIKAFQDSDVVGSYKVIKDEEERKQREKLIEQIKDLEYKYQRLLSAIKKETQFNKKVELNIEAQKTKQKIAQLKSRL